MSDLRIYELPAASAWDGYIPQDKSGGATEKVSIAQVETKLEADNFLRVNTPTAGNLAQFNGTYWTSRTLAEITGEVNDNYTDFYLGTTLTAVKTFDIPNFWLKAGELIICGYFIHNAASNTATVSLRCGTEIVWTKTHTGAGGDATTFFRVVVNFIDAALGAYIVTYHQSGSAPELLGSVGTITLEGETGFTIKVVGATADNGAGIISVRTN